jgi:two-component system, LuxR family, sensor kinase FixL
MDADGHPLAAVTPEMCLELRRDGTILRLAGRGLQAFRLGEEAVGRRIGDVLPPPYPDIVLREVAQALDEGRVLLTAHRVGEGSDARSFESRTIPVDADRVVRVVTDTTQQILWWQELRGNEAKFRLLFEQAADGIFVFDEHGVILDANARAGDSLGCSRAHLVGTPFTERLPAPSPAHLMRVCGTLEPPGSATVAAIQRRVDGSTFPVEMRVGRLDVEGPPRFLALVRDVSERRHVERVALDAAEEEQRRIGRDLHDGLGQHLAGLKFLARALERALKARGVPEANEALEIGRQVELAMAHTRALAHGLAPVDVHGTELAPALDGLASDTTETCGLPCEFELGGRPVCDDACAASLYRIAQEAVTNALKHADPSCIHIRLREVADGVELVVTDDGAGAPSTRRGRGVGQRLMALRAERIGATLDISSVPGAGTTVRCLVGRRRASGPLPSAR